MRWSWCSKSESTSWRRVPLVFITMKPPGTFCRIHKRACLLVRGPRDRCERAIRTYFQSSLCCVAMFKWFKLFKPFNSFKKPASRKVSPGCPRESACGLFHPAPRPEENREDRHRLAWGRGCLHGANCCPRSRGQGVLRQSFVRRGPYPCILARLPPTVGRNCRG